MKTETFQHLIDQLGDLSDVQREALSVALSSEGFANEVIAIIEARFAETPACGHCHSQNFGGWGYSNDLRRYKCRDCKRTFNALTGTPLAHLHRRDAWLAYARALVDRVPLRKAATRAGICLVTSFRWRHRFNKAAQNKRPAKLTGIVETDETFILKSAKGSRNIVGRKPRKRGGTATKPGLSTKEHDCILIVRDRHGTTTDYILPDLEGATFKARLSPIIAKGAVLVSDGRKVYRGFANGHEVWHIDINASKGEHVYAGFHIQNVNAYMSRLKGWLRPFNGVASKYLASYLGWRRMIERDGESLTPQRYLTQALG